MLPAGCAEAIRALHAAGSDLEAALVGIADATPILLAVLCNNDVARVALSECGARMPGAFLHAFCQSSVAAPNAAATVDSLGDADSLRKAAVFRNARGDSALVWALRYGTAEVLNMLLRVPEIEASFALADAEGRMPLHWALARKDCTALVERLAASADVDVTRPTAVRAVPRGSFVLLTRPHRPAKRRCTFCVAALRMRLRSCGCFRSSSHRLTWRTQTV